MRLSGSTVLIPLPELVGRISKFLKTEKDEVLFGNRKQINCHARNLICFIAVKSMGYKFNEIADTLKIYPVKCLPNEMKNLFHRGVAYLTGVQHRKIQKRRILTKNLELCKGLI